MKEKEKRKKELLRHEKEKSFHSALPRWNFSRKRLEREATSRTIPRRGRKKGNMLTFERARLMGI